VSALFDGRFESVDSKSVPLPTSAGRESPFVLRPSLRWQKENLMRHFLAVLFVASSAFAQTPACHDARNKDLCAELLTIEQRDQSVRAAAMADSQNIALISEMNKADREDLARVEAIIAK
jgi:hypothetical protein